MPKTVKVAVIAIATLLFLPLLNAQQPQAAQPAPVPTQIMSARRVFISNTADGNSLIYFWKIGGPIRPYDEFYAAMKAWGRYELVNAPSDADLVFEIRFGEPAGIAGAPCIVSILDAKTRFTLWTIIEPMQGALRKGTWEKNFTQGIAKVMEDLKKLSAEQTTSDKDVRK